MSGIFQHRFYLLNGLINCEHMILFYKHVDTKNISDVAFLVAFDGSNANVTVRTAKDWNLLHNLII